MARSDRSTVAWTRALSLRERRGGSAPPSDRDLAERRLSRWHGQPPFEDCGLFGQRLAQDELTESDLLAVLGESPRRLARRMTAAPEWLATLREAFGATERSATPPREHNEGALLVVAQPLIDRAASIVRAGMPDRFPTDLVTGMLAQALPGKLFPMLARTLALELHVARDGGVLAGDTPTDRFWSYVELLAESDAALELLQAYPVLARQLVECLDQWATASLELVTRLDADWDALCATFGQLGELESVQSGLSDPHDGGRGVLIARFSSGLGVVYKPKSLAVDQHFQELLAWLNARGQTPPLRTLRIIDRGNYGWAELVEPRPCAARAEVERFYARQGSLLAILHALAATDFHYENLVADGENPVLIDLEALFHPNLRGAEADDAFQQALSQLDESVLSVGLLPQLMRLNPGAAGLDVSGLGASGGQLSPRGVPSWEGGASDEARVVYRRVPLNAGVHKPVLDGPEVGVLEHSDALLEGYRATYRLLLRERDALLADEGPLARFANDEVRLLLRPTVVYARLLGESFHPDLLRDALERDRFFDRLWVAVRYQPRLIGAIRAEQDDLLHGDIPKFVTQPDSRDVACAGQLLIDYVEESGISVMRRRLQRVSEDDLAQQTWFVRAALGSLPGAHGPGPRGFVAAAAGEPPDLLAAARAIGDRLEQVAFRGKGEAAWISLVTSNGASVAPLGSDLYEGLPGVALFLAYLGEVLGEARFTELARAALKNLRRQLDDGLAVPGTIGAFSGWGGILYTLSHLGVLWRDSALVDEALGLCERIEPLIDEDAHSDIASGAAGCLAALLTLYRVSGAPEALRLAVRCGVRLLDTDLPRLTGFAHGAAGIAWALLDLASVTGDVRFKHAAGGLLRYERGLFSADVQNWPDLRTDEPSFMVAWCHGAAGVGLGRLASLRLTDDASMHGEIATAVNTTVARGAGMSHALCHGDLGNIDLLVSAAQQYGDWYQLERARSWAAGVLRVAEQDGWHCATPFGLEGLGLMTGLCGIGYELLRLADPVSVPSVLMLAAPPMR